MFSLPLSLQPSQKCFGVFTVGCSLVKCSLSHTVCVSALPCCDEDRVHTACGGPDLLACRHCPSNIPMEPGILAFIHVINSVKPCLKAPHAFLCPQAQGCPTQHHCGKHRYVTAAAYLHSRPLPCIIFHWGGKRDYFHIDTHKNTAFSHFKHDRALIN